MTAEARTPFTFVVCHELRESLGRRAHDERELMEALAEVPAGSVFHHVFGYFLHQRFSVGPYANDFASWAGREVRDRVLAERLTVLDPFACRDLEHLRRELIAIVDGHLSRLPVVPRVVYGEPFCFVQSHVVEVPTGEQARTLAEFRDGLAQIDASAIYYHTVVARARLERRAGDFADWLRASLDRSDLAEQIERIDLYFLSLERVRARILALVDAALEGGTSGPAPGEPRSL
jgi:hypothetical protein